MFSKSMRPVIICLLIILGIQDIRAGDKYLGIITFIIGAVLILLYAAEKFYKKE